MGTHEEGSLCISRHTWQYWGTILNICRWCPHQPPSVNTNPMSPLTRSYLRSDQMVGSKPFSSPTLDHREKAIRWSSGAKPAPDTAMADWIKLAFNVTKKGDKYWYAHLIWSQCLSFARLGLQEFWYFFPRTQFPLLPFFFFFLGRRFRGKFGWIPRVYIEPNGFSPRAIYQWALKQQRSIEALYMLWLESERSQMC